MRLFGKVDGTIDRYDRAAWLSLPFDLAFEGAVVGPVIVPSVPGEEFSLPASRMHWTIPGQPYHLGVHGRLDAIADGQPLHVGVSGRAHWQAEED